MTLLMIFVSVFTTGGLITMAIGAATHEKVLAVGAALLLPAAFTLIFVPISRFFLGLVQ